LGQPFRTIASTFVLYLREMNGGNSPMRPTPEDRDRPRLLWARACDPIAFDGLVADSHHHDHDEELGTYAESAPLNRPRPRRSDLAFWLETGKLVKEYLEMQAGAAYNDTMRQGFIAWLQRSPGQRRQYLNGDDMGRAALVEWYLKVVR
jgi:hypothetical protein